MSEEFHILTPGEVEGGQEIAADTAAAIEIVAANIDAIVALAATIDDSGNITMVNMDGNLTTIKIRRDTAANWASLDPVLDTGEIGINLTAVDPYEMKVGDGTKRWSELNNFLLLADFGNAELDAAVAAAQLAEANAEESAGIAEAAAAEANDAMGAAATSAQLSQDWATAAETTPLPGGKKSAEVSAGIAAQIATTSRLVDRSPLISAGELVSTGMLFKKRRYAGGSDITITVPTGVYSSTEDREAWMIYRKEGTGNINVVAAAGGSDLQAPVLKANGSIPYRNVGSVTGGANIAVTGSIAVPAVTAGKLVMFIQLIIDSGVMTMTNPSLTGALTATMTPRLPLVAGNVLSGSGGVFDQTLTSFAGGTVNYSVTVGPNVHSCIVHWFVVEGNGGEMKTPVDYNFGVAAAAANVSVTLLAVPASSLMLGVAFMRGSEGNVTFSSFGSVLTLLGSGVTTGTPDTAASDTGNNKNSAYARGAGVNSVAGDIVIQANFSSAYTFPRLIGICYPPKTVAGAGDVILKTEAGRTALTVLNGEMELLFDPDGKTVFVKTPKP